MLIPAFLNRPENGGPDRLGETQIATGAQILMASVPNLFEGEAQAAFA
jgi:hypothetical protein